MKDNIFLMAGVFGGKEGVERISSELLFCNFSSCMYGLCLNFINSENIFIGFFDSVLPVMLSSKLLPEMEMDDNSKRDQLLQGMQNLPITTQIEKLKVILSL